MKNIAVTSKEYNKAPKIFKQALKEQLNCLEAPAEEDALVSFIKQHNIDHVIIGVEKYQSALYQNLKQGSVIARFGVGADNVNLETADQYHLICTNTPEVLTTSVAEHAMSLLLNASKKIASFDKSMHSGKFEPSTCSEVRNKNLTIIGTGQISQCLAQIASKGFGMNVTGVSNPKRTSQQELNQTDFSAVTTSFRVGVEEADFISLHLPHNHDTHHFINETSILFIPKKAWLINTSRGGLINEEILFDALHNHQLAGAGLDVFEKEPYRPFSEAKDLRLLPNTILTPHVSSTTVEACNRMAKLCLKNIFLAEKNEFSKMNLINNTKVLL